MRITLPPLKRTELQLLLDILNAKTGRKDPAAPLIELEQKARAYMADPRNGIEMVKERWGRAWGDLDELKTHTQLHRRWEEARQPLESAIVDQRHKTGFFLPLPQLGLPSKKPLARIFLPVDLSCWLLARAVANRQHWRLVKCALCPKFGLRARAKRDARYCSERCQRLANVEQMKKKYADEFSPLRVQHLEELAEKLGGRLQGKLAREYLVAREKMRRIESTS